MKYLIPFACSFLFHAGGMDQWKWCPLNQKWWRWLGLGLLIGITFAILKHSWVPLLCIAAYYGVTSGLPYGEKSWLNKIMPRDMKWGFYGMAFGLASMPVVGVGMALAQAIVGMVSFWGLMKLSNDGVKGWKLQHKYVEIGLGFLGTLVFAL